MLNTYFNCHTHTMYSNLRLLDSINKPEDLINESLKIGLSGLAITDHEALCSHMKVNKMAKNLLETNPEFCVALGNEIYLVESREERRQKYYHFLLIAKDEIGYKALKELSSIAWYNMYSYGKIDRVPTLKKELIEVVRKYKGHLIATTACIGGELGSLILKLFDCEDDIEEANEIKQKICDFIKFCQDLFEDDFYLECAPSGYAEQIEVNKKIRQIAKAFNLPVTVGTDAHYLKKEDRYVHKAYLTSTNNSEDREVDDFYAYAYLMSPEECRELLRKSFDDEYIDFIFENSLKIKDKINFFSLEKHQEIPRVEVKNYEKTLSWFDQRNDLRDALDAQWPTLKSLFLSDEIQERYWVNQCFEGLIEKNIGLKEEYLDRLEIEAHTKRVIGEKLNTCMFAYPNTLQHYIDLFWRCGSTVGAGRGSACSGLNHYLLGITQLDPIQWGLPFWRYMNDERVELGSLRLILPSCKKRM